MDLFQAFRVHMGVYLRCRYVLMSQKDLDRPQVRPALQEVRGKCVPYRVRRHAAPVQLEAILPYDLPDGLAGYHTSTAVRKKILPRGLLRIQMAAMGPKDGPDAKDILSRLHTNGDGTINETEFTTAMNTVESILSSASGDESDASISDLMEMLGAALNAYQQASSTSYTSYTQASQTTGSSFYA